MGLAVGGALGCGLGVERCPDTAAEEKVQAMLEAILDKAEGAQREAAWSGRAGGLESVPTTAAEGGGRNARSEPPPKTPADTST